MFVLHLLPDTLPSPGYIAHLKGSDAESAEYYKKVLRLDPFNIVATSDLAHRAEHAVSFNIRTPPSAHFDDLWTKFIVLPNFAGNCQ